MNANELGKYLIECSECATALENVKEYYKSATMYRRAKEYEKAADMYILSKSFYKASYMYFKANELRKSIEALQNTHNHALIISYCTNVDHPTELATVAYDDLNEILATYGVRGDYTNAILAITYEEMGDYTNAIKYYIKNLNYEKCTELYGNDVSSIVSMYLSVIDIYDSISHRRGYAFSYHFERELSKCIRAQRKTMVYLC
jgi:tetratricopeptide (TPR) repeat protein